jgi:hypothetical protein
MVDANPSQGVNGPSGPYGPVGRGGRLRSAASALPRIVRVDFARRNPSGKIAHPAGPQGRNSAGRGRHLRAMFGSLARRFPATRTYAASRRRDFLMSPCSPARSCFFATGVNEFQSCLAAVHLIGIAFSVSYALVYFVINPRPVRPLDAQRKPWRWRPFMLADATNYRASHTRMLILREVDDEAALVLAASKFGSRLTELRSMPAPGCGRRYQIALPKPVVAVDARR